MPSPATAEPEAPEVPRETPGGDAEPVEVVERAEVLPARQPSPSEEAANQAIVAASDAAINNPGIPGRDEFLSLAMQARVLSMSGAAPKLVRNNPHLAFHVAMIGRDLGISPSAALELIDVIDGRNGPQLSLSPQLLNGQIRRLGLGSIIPVIKTPARCVAVALGPGGFYDPRCKPLWPDHHELCECTIRAFLGESEFTWEDARMAGLVAQGCEPGNHTERCKDRQTTSALRCNQGYVTYPKRMMWWRCSGFLADDIFPEASLGLYSPEALGAVVDEDGRPVDPSAVELPEGYEPKALAAPKAGPPAEADVLDDLKVRVAALPEAQRSMYREKWMESRRLQGFTLENLPADRLSLAQSMLKGFENIAAREGWDPDGARAEVLARREESPGEPDPAPTEAVSAAEAAEAPEGEESPSEPGGDDPGDVAGSERHGPDPAIAAWVRDVSAAADAEQPGLVASIVEEVKAMHHATVNRELAEVGFEPGDHHIDTRRMVLTAVKVQATLRPGECKVWRCDGEAGEGGLCTDHRAFLMARTTWTCESCGISGDLEIPDGAGVYEGVHLLVDHHADVAEDCTFDLARVRLTPPRP